MKLGAILLNRTFLLTLFGNISLLHSSKALVLAEDLQLNGMGTVGGRKSGGFSLTNCMGHAIRLSTPHCDKVTQEDANKILC